MNKLRREGLHDLLVMDLIDTGGENKHYQMWWHRRHHDYEAQVQQMLKEIYGRGCIPNRETGEVHKAQLSRS